MIALLKPVRPKKSTSAWHGGFLGMLPQIQKYARRAFRDLRKEAQEEAIAETIANAMVVYARLFELGKEDLAFPTVLVRYAAAHIHAGRRVGTRLSSNDISAEVAQKRHGFKVEPIDYFDTDSGEWKEAVVADTHTPVPDQAAFRCDFPKWLADLSSQKRRIAEVLSLGHSTSDVAKRFKLSSGRVSQIRAELHTSWLEFHGENDLGNRQNRNNNDCTC